jgi:hypothetical protein
MMTKDRTQIHLALPSDLHRQIVKAAKSSGSTITGEIVSRLVASFAPSEAEKYEEGTKAWLDLIREQQATINRLVAQLGERGK